MTRKKKIILGILTFLPVFSILAYFFVFLKFFFSTLGTAANDPFIEEVFFESFIILFILIIVAILSGIALMIYYIIHANSNPNFDSNQKLIWILILVLSSFIGNIIYYFIEIIPDKQINQ
ncbi:MAG: hypothetical protein WDZ45_14485 [Flavobacteriaceae bacterium]